MLLLNCTRKGSVSYRRALLWRSKVKVSIVYQGQRSVNLIKVKGQGQYC